MAKELSQPVITPLTGRPLVTADSDVKTGRASDEYRKSMPLALRSSLRQISKVLQECVDADGGYLSFRMCTTTA